VVIHPRWSEDNIMMKRSPAGVRRAVRPMTLLLGVLSVGAAVAGDRSFNAVSPALNIVRSSSSHPMPSMHMRGGRARSIDGRSNNFRDRAMGAAGTQLRRLVPSDYGDGVSSLAGGSRPGPRAVSNAVSAQAGPIPNPFGLSDYLWQWGQFVDHDIDLTGGVDPPEPADVPVPLGDLFFDPTGTGTARIALNRSIYDPTTGISPARPREQINEITAWIDASNVYGSDDSRAAALRANDGTGRLRTSAGDLLPRNTEGLPNAGGARPDLFLAGDVRANEQAGLTAMHTLFVREHNRLAGLIAAANPGLDDDGIYERARRLVGAEMQVITYREFLPALLGPQAPRRYRGYRSSVDARIANLFSTAAYRFGHSALSPTLRRVDADLEEIPAGHLALRDAFFAPQRISDEGGIDPILRGLAHQVCQRIDPYVVDDVRNFLFGPPGAGGFDLPSLNIQRGRDHGLPSYNDVRAGLGLSRALAFADVSSDPEIQARLASVYSSVDDLDAWVGGLAEDPLPGSQVGALVATVLRQQFEALRDGDRFWYTRTLTARERVEVERTRLSDVIRRNTGIGDEIPDDVFRVGGS
jgi:peroxidase